MRIKNLRPGPLVIPDAKLKLASGEVVEARQVTRQIKSALDRGFVEKVNDNMPTGAPPKPKKPRIPPMNHPWRRQQFGKFVKQQEHHQNLKKARDKRQIY